MTTPQELIGNLGELPPLPQVAAQVLRLSADSETSADELQRLIRADQALTAQTLRIANSAMFGMVREVSTLTQATMTLGFSTTRSVVLAASVKSLFNRGPAGIQERLLWEHALVVGLTGSAIGRALGYHPAEEVFLAGLMHDLGKSVLLLKFPERYGTLLKRIYDEGGDATALEREAFDLDHPLVGEALVRSWHLSHGIEATLRWHHSPLDAPVEHQRLVALVALGNQMALDLQVGLGSPESLAAATREARQILDLDDAAFAQHRSAALEALDRDKALLTEF